LTLVGPDHHNPCCTAAIKCPLSSQNMKEQPTLW